MCPIRKYQHRLAVEAVFDKVLCLQNIPYSRSPHVCVGFLQVVQLPPTMQRHPKKNRLSCYSKLSIGGRFVSICLSCDEPASYPGWTPPSASISWDRLQPTHYPDEDQRSHMIDGWRFETTISNASLPAWTLTSTLSEPTDPQRLPYPLPSAYTRKLFVDFGSAFNTISPLKLIGKRHAPGSSTTHPLWQTHYCTSGHQAGQHFQYIKDLAENNLLLSVSKTKDLIVYFREKCQGQTAFLHQLFINQTEVRAGGVITAGTALKCHRLTSWDTCPVALPDLRVKRTFLQGSIKPPHV